MQPLWGMQLELKYNYGYVMSVNKGGTYHCTCITTPLPDVHASHKHASILIPGTTDSGNYIVNEQYIAQLMEFRKL